MAMYGAAAMLEHQNAIPQHGTSSQSQGKVVFSPPPPSQHHQGTLLAMHSLDSSLTSLGNAAHQPPKQPISPRRRRKSTTTGRAKRGGATIPPTSRSSHMRGVTRHTRTGRYDAHIWCDGRQWYLGAFTSELLAGAAYDVAAIKMRPNDLPLNLPHTCYHGRLGQLLDQVD